MNDANGKWVGWGIGDVDPKVAQIQTFLAHKFHSYAGTLVATGTYDQFTADVVSQMQRNYGLPVTGIFDYASQLKSGFIKPTPKPRVPFFTVEGHLSDMFHGPVADTATELENEGRVAHFPTGYNNGALPFDNQSGVNELQSRVDQFAPLGTKFVVAGYSQGGIVVSDWLIDNVSGTPREHDILGVLFYGNPCRRKGSVAPWSRAQAGPAENAGLDPKKRMDLLNVTFPFPIMDVYRKGDIFSDNEPTREGDVKASVYEAVARADFFDNQYSILADIAALFTVTYDEVWAIFLAIVSGIGFAANQGNNPHYAPFDLTGGINWMRQQLT